MWSRAKKWPPKYILVFLLVFIAAVQGTLSYQSHAQKRLDKNPIRGIAKEVYAIDKQIPKLTNDNKNNESTARDYLSTLDNLQRSCQRIADYKKQSKATNKLSARDSARVDETTALCEDLTNLVKTAKNAILPAEPLLLANAKPKRYQTLGPLKNNMREEHDKQTKQAITNYGNHEFSSGDFPFSTANELKELKIKIDQSRGTGYLPALGKFQKQLLGDRIQYWISYSDVDSLSKSLQKQLRGYCQNLGKEAPTVICKHSLN